MEENYIKNEGRNVVSINSLIILAYRVVLSIGTVNRLYRTVEVAHHDYMPGMEREICRTDGFAAYTRHTHPH